MPPSLPERSKLFHSPYTSPKVRVGDWIHCALRGRVRVCGFGRGRIPCPMCKHEPGRANMYVVYPDLARAVRVESRFAISYWWGVSTTLVTRWRKRLGVPENNEGTRRLHKITFRAGKKVYRLGIPVATKQLKAHWERPRGAKATAVQRSTHYARTALQAGNRIAPSFAKPNNKST